MKCDFGCGKLLFPACDAQLPVCGFAELQNLHTTMRAPRLKPALPAAQSSDTTMRRNHTQSCEGVELRLAQVGLVRQRQRRCVGTVWSSYGRRGLDK
jgi:hypothetical protein